MVPEELSAGSNPSTVSTAPHSQDAAVHPVPSSSTLRYTVTLRGALAIAVKPGPANKSFEVMDIKSGGAADAWNKLVKAKRAPIHPNRTPEPICSGDLLVELAGVDVTLLEYEVVKSLLQKNSKMPDWDFDLTFVRELRM